MNVLHRIVGITLVTACIVLPANAATLNVTGAKVYSFAATESYHEGIPVFEIGNRYIGNGTTGETWGGTGVRVVNWGANDYMDISGYSHVNVDIRRVAGHDALYAKIVLKSVSTNGTIVASDPKVLDFLTSDYVTYSKPLYLFNKVDLKRIVEVEIQYEQGGINPAQIKDVAIKNIRFTNNDKVQYISGQYHYTYAAVMPNTAYWSVIEDVLTYTFNPDDDPQYAGMGIILNNADKDWETRVDLTPYRRIVLELHGDTSEIAVQLKKDDTTESQECRLIGVSKGAYMQYELDFDFFGDWDFSQVRAIHIKPRTGTANRQHVFVKNICFDDVDNYTLRDTLYRHLLSIGYNQVNHYSPIITGADYQTHCSHVWEGYKNYFIDSYRPLVDPSVKGLVFDPQSAPPSVTSEDSHWAKSESSGYGMLLALYMNDQRAFDEILGVTWSKLRKTGNELFAWRVNTSGEIPDYNSATDGDEDIALALIFADTLVKKGIWSDTQLSYGTKAQTLIDAIYDHDLELTLYMKPGDGWGGRRVTNPSYFAPAWYRVFDLYESTDHDWEYLVDQGYRMITGNAGYEHGIVPDWCSAWGESAEPINSDLKYQMRWDAIRIYWRLALDAIWFNEPRAIDFLENTPTLFEGYGGTVKPSEITFLDMDGNAISSTTDSTLIPMLGVGSMGISNNSYRSEWKTLFDTHLYYSLAGPVSFFGEQGEEWEKYNYFYQSLSMIAALTMSGAFPNLFTDLTELHQPPSLTSVQIPQRVHRNSLFEVPIAFACPAGGGFVNTIGMRILHQNGQSVELRMINDGIYSPCEIVSDPYNVLRMAAADKHIVGTNLIATFNIVIDATWAQGGLTFKYIVDDKKGNTTTVWQTMGNSVYYPYEFTSISPTYTEIAFTGIDPLADNAIAFVRVTAPVEIACGSTSWNVSVYTDNDPVKPGDNGLAHFDVSGNILNVIPLKAALLDSTQSTPDSLSDPALHVVYDKQDNGEKTLLRGSAPTSQTARYLYVGGDFKKAPPGAYRSGLHIRLYTPENVSLIDDFEDGLKLSELGTYWVPISLYEEEVAEATTTSISLVDGGYKNGKSLKLNYTLGSRKDENNGPQAILLCNLNAESPTASLDISSYKGISLIIKAKAPHPLAVTIESVDVHNDYDYYIHMIPSPSDQWIKYDLYFEDFGQQGFGSAVDLNAVLRSVNNIQLKSMSERTGETNTIWLDDVRLIP